MKLAVFILPFLFSFGMYAQSDTLNQKDSLGRKQGYWIIYGKDEPQKGYPAKGKISEGTYLNDRKNGEWIMYYRDGETPKIKGVFQNNRPIGPYEKYYEDGSLMEKGTFLKRGYGGKKKTFWKNGNKKSEHFFNENRELHGKALHYFENGVLEAELKYDNGNLIDTTKIFFSTGKTKLISIHDKDRTFYTQTDQKIIHTSSSCIIDSCCSQYKQWINLNGSIKIYDEDNEVLYEGSLKDVCSYYSYDANGSLIKVESSGNSEGNNSTQQYKLDSIHLTSRCLKEFYGTFKQEGIKFNGYNKVIKNKKELLLEGEFKNGCLWDGRYYVYDDDGLLLRVEVYKEGKYHSDGQL